MNSESIELFKEILYSEYGCWDIITEEFKNWNDGAEALFFNASEETDRLPSREHWFCIVWVGGGNLYGKCNCMYIADQLNIYEMDMTDPNFDIYDVKRLVAYICAFGELPKDKRMYGSESGT